MGIFSRASDKDNLKAEYAPQVMTDYYYGYNPYVYTAVSRQEALTVPALSRCRNLIAGTISSFPLELYRKSTGEELGLPLWMEQPSLHQPRAVTIGMTVDSLFFFGVAYWRVTEVYAEDGRPARFEWVANTRVTPYTNDIGTYVEYYMVDGRQVPNSGLGSLVTFQGLTEGILNHGNVIRAAIDVQRAAVTAAATPMATGFLKNTGADLPPAEVSGLLSAWNASRKKNSTAYLTSTLDYQTVGYSPKDMMYSEAIQNLATEIARLCNVPAYYVSADQNTSMTYANVQDERKQFVSLSLQPFVSAIEERLSMNDITAAGHEVKFDIDRNFLRSEPLVELQVIEKLLTLNLITPEQAMEMTHLTPNGNGAM